MAEAGGSTKASAIYGVMGQFTKADWFQLWGLAEGTPEGDAAWAVKEVTLARHKLMGATGDHGPSLTLVSDISSFQSPVDGSVISSRSSLREHCKKHDVVQVGNDLRGSRPDMHMPRAGHDIKRALETARG